MEKFDYETDITIIGAGPAGLTAALYARRANLSVIILDKLSPGGKVITTALVENYPGYSQITGPDLGFKMFEQTQNLGAKFLFNEALDITTTKTYHYVLLKNNKIIKTKTVIIATGMINRKIGCPGEDDFFHKGISYCAICDGSLHKDLPVAVIGSGLSAIEESIYLSDIVSKVYLISNKSSFKADNFAINKLEKAKNIETIMETDTLSFNGDNKLESVTIRDQKTNETKNILVHGAFIYIGYLPVCPTINKKFLSEKNTFINVNLKMETIIPGIFASGDIINKTIRQISTAVSDGTIAALSAVEYISNNIWE